MLDTFPALRTLTQRQLELLHLKGIQLPDSEFRVIDLSQNLGFANVVVDKFPCVTPDGQKFMSRLCRFTSAVEYLRFQGIWLDEAKLSKYSPSFLQDLAGNSYEVSCCAANYVCCMVFLAMNFRMHMKQRTLQGFSGQGSPAVEGDDSEVDLDSLSFVWWNARASAQKHAGA